MDQLRWILIGLGLLILAGIYLFANPERKARQTSKKKASRAKKNANLTASASRPVASEPTRRIEPVLGQNPADAITEPEQQQMPIEQDLPDPFAPEPDEPPVAPAIPASQASVNTAAQPVASAPAAPVISLYVVADERQLITGVELLDAALKVGLRYGDQNIFHRLQEGSETPLFSMANLSPPGTFDKDAWNLFETRGMALFMSMDSTISAVDAWDSMLATADRLAGLLRARIIDDQHKPLTRLRIGEIREQARQFDRESD